MLAYLSLLSTDDYLPGVLVLHRSLMETNPIAPFFLLVTDNVREDTCRILDRHQIDYSIVKYVSAPSSHSISDYRFPHFSYVYSKLHIFGLSQFRKIVYLDADVVVLSNIDDLFQKPHMSAVNCGGMLPEYRHWVDFAAGFLVVEPSLQECDRIMSIFSKTDPSTFQSDQDILHLAYPDWPSKKELHLDHGYQILHTYIDRYAYHFGYCVGQGKNAVKAIHYAQLPKPWEMTRLIRKYHRVSYFFSTLYWKNIARHLKQMPPKTTRQLIRICRNPLPLERQSLELWLSYYDRISQSRLS